MATVASGLNGGTGFGSSDTITSTTLNDHVNDATVTNIVTGDIASSSGKTTGVTFAKMQHISTEKLLGRTTSGEGTVEEVDISGSSGILLDEDDMSSNSNTRGATQQSIIEYIASISNQYFHLQEVETSGTNSSTTLTANAYTKRPVASVSNNITGASVSSGVITLPAGTYEVRGFSMCGEDGVGDAPNRTRFRNTSDSSNAILGVSVRSIGETNVDNQCHPVAGFQGVFTIASTKNFELQHYKRGSGNVLGGYAASSGDNEVYADVLIKKVD